MFNVIKRDYQIEVTNFHESTSFDIKMLEMRDRTLAKAFDLRMVGNKAWRNARLGTEFYNETLFVIRD